MSDESKIIQLIPGNGWQAVFQDDEGDIHAPIVCFALVEIREDGEVRTEVRPMTVDERLISFCDDVTNFSRVEPSSK